MKKKVVIISIDYLGELNAEGKIKLTGFAVPNSTIYNQIEILDKKLLEEDKYFASIYFEYAKTFKVNSKGKVKFKAISKKKALKKKHLNYIFDIDGCLTGGKNQSINVPKINKIRDLINHKDSKISICTGRTQGYVEVFFQLLVDKKTINKGVINLYTKI